MRFYLDTHADFRFLQVAYQTQFFEGDIGVKS